MKLLSRGMLFYQKLYKVAAYKRPRKVCFRPRRLKNELGTSNYQITSYEVKYVRVESIR